MNLSKKEYEHFFLLMWALQYFVNCKLKIHPTIQNLRDYTNSDIEKKANVREALYENIEIIDSFIKENPENLSKADLLIVSSWRKYVEGQFYIERFLKKHTVFIQDEKVYGVLGLQQPLNDLVHQSNLPLYVHTVLLPFEGKIIYDGLLGHHNISFGGGVKRELKETYMRAKQNNRIIDCLEMSCNNSSAQSQPKHLKNWKPEIDQLAIKSKKLRGSVEQPTIYSPAFSLVKASVGFAQLAVSNETDPETLQKALDKVRRAFNKSQTVLNREENY
ncbi:MAG: hypothetical protein GY702_25510 [Desulfobulbaceae bacterium]|nr:hypothetical protein [Desulfobulbaceae bacterium]